MTRWQPNQLRFDAQRQVARSVKPRAKRPRRDEEHNEQVVFFNRVRAMAENDKRYAMAARRTHAIPNGGGRSKAEGGRLKAEGVTAGVSDVFVAYPVGQWHGLYIEMKSLTGRPSREQKDWIRDSTELGYFAVCARGADEAWEVWQAYVAGGDHGQA